MKRLICKPELALAIREDRKTETRRLPKCQPFVWAHKVVPGPITTSPAGGTYGKPGDWIQSSRSEDVICGLGCKPAYRVGDIVGISEPWTVDRLFDACPGRDLVAKYPLEHVHYLADGAQPASHGRYRQARFLPDAFIRTKVKILGVEMSRLQDITEAQAIAEGMEDPRPIMDIGPNFMRMVFKGVWDHLHPGHPWDSNPWVWRYRFERHTLHV